MGWSGIDTVRLKLSHESGLISQRFKPQRARANERYVRPRCFATRS